MRLSAFGLQSLGIIKNAEGFVYKDRREAAEQLAKNIKGWPLVRPIVLGIPRGGVVTAAALANSIGADLGVVIVKKLRSPWNPELAIGALAEGGRSYLSSYGRKIELENPAYLKSEIEEQTQELEGRVERLRKTHPRADWAHRSVILTDDGIATGATFLAALQVVKAEHPLEVIVAVPVLSREMIKKLKKQCDKLLYLEAPEDFLAVGQFYLNFESVPMERVEDLLKENLIRSPN